MEIWSYIGIAAVGYIGFDFIKKLGKSLPILELMILIAGLQWVIGPIIEYNSPSGHYKYFMYVTEDKYMEFVVPAYLFFSGVVLLITKGTYRFHLNLEQLSRYTAVGIQLFIAGFVYDFLSGFLGFLGFIGYIVSNLKFVGAIILFFSKNKKHKRFFYFAILLLFYQSLQRALFHDFILWSVFFFIFWCYQYKPTKKTILLIFFASGIFLITVQTIKATYRTKIWEGYSGNKVELFLGLLYTTITSGNVSLSAQNENDISNNVRLNQGWIISAIMKNIPEKTNYFNGQTIADAIYSSLVPRFVNPEKEKAGGRKNFKRFTSLRLSKNTSMGISIIGESYGNFGVYGGILFMAIWSFFLGKVWLFFFKKMQNNPLISAFLPLIFLQVIKAETELVVVLNYLIKVSIFILVLLYLIKNSDNRYAIQ